MKKVITIEGMKRRVRGIIDKYNNMSQECKGELIKLGFHQEDLGGGESNYILSEQIKIKKWEGKKVLAVGISSVYRGGHRVGHRVGEGFTIYRAMVLEINKNPGRKIKHPVDYLPLLKNHIGEIRVMLGKQKWVKWMQGVACPKQVKGTGVLKINVSKTKGFNMGIEVVDPPDIVLIPMNTIDYIVLLPLSGQDNIALNINKSRDTQGEKINFEIDLEKREMYD